MFKIKDLFKEAKKASLRIKNILILVVLFNIVSFFIGSLLIALENPFAIQLRDWYMEVISTFEVINYIEELLKSDNLLQAIIVTFLYNLFSGAFLSTFSGVIPFIGVIYISFIIILRGFLIGAVSYEIFSNFNPSLIGYFIVFIGTLFLEFGAYVFSASAGINIGLSIIFPKRYFTDNRFEAFKKSLKDCLKIYIIVSILLLLGAIWEMTGTFLIFYSK
ncbi:MAG: hypothetical protein QXV60_01055 [Nitrososphaerota archaeon]